MKKKNTLRYPEEYKHVLEIFESYPKKSFNVKQIAFHIPPDFKCSLKDIEKIIAILEKEELIEETQPGKFRYVAQFSLLKGKVDMTQRGAAYVICEDLEEDIFISPSLLGQAFNGDTVMVELLHQSKSRKPEGRIVQVIERVKTQFIGTVQKFKGSAFVIPDDPKVHTDFFVSKKYLKNAKDQDKVKIEITEWLPGEKNPNAKVIDIFGKAGEHQTEMHAIIAEFGFQTEFPDQVEKAAAAFSDKLSEKDLKNRRDFRKTLTFTIDPEDAKDFDDALSFKKLENGHFEIGIHIADVSHYVTEGSHLDEEALHRGTSVYLVDRVIPMLPEKLSNDLCSLRPNVDRLCYAVVVEMNDKAEVISKWIGKTVIHSDRRFSYEEAQERLETTLGDLHKELILLNKLAHLLKDKRFQNGAISFETEEVKFKLDEEGRPVSVYKKIRKDAHKLVEEFMLLANRLVAQFVATELKNAYVPYRVHDAPSMQKMTLLIQIASRFGFKIKTETRFELAQSINQMTGAVADKPEATILNPLAIRSMEKAIYTTAKTSHFGLAFDYYCHFTSPIRRYPDLITHRLLTDYLNKKNAASKEETEKICKHSSAMEQKAVEAERASIKYKQTEFLTGHIGEIFDGTVVSLTDWGIFIELADNKCEGMVRISEIKGDFYEFYEKDYAVVGRRTKKRLELGQKVQVKIRRTNMLKRNTDFTLLDY